MDSNPFDEVPAPRNGAKGVVAPLLRSWYILLLLGLVGLAGGVVFAAKKANHYDSTGKILVRFGARETLVADAAHASLDGVGSSNQDVLNELQILTNPALFETLARQIGPEVILAPVDPTAQDTAETPFLRRWFHRLQARLGGSLHDRPPTSVDAAARALQQAVRVTLEPGSSVISFTARAGTPELAQRIVKEMLSLAVERHGEVFTTDSSYRFIEKRRQVAEEERDRIVSRLHQLEQDHQIVDLETQRSSLIAETLELRRLFEQDAQTLAALAAKRQVLEDLLGEQAPTIEIAVDSQPVPNARRSSLDAGLARLQMERIDLLRTLPEDSIEVRNLDIGIDRIQQLVLAEPLFLQVEAGAPRVVQNPEYARLQAELRSEAIERSGLEASREARARQLEQRQETLERLGALELEVSRLEQQRDLAVASAQQAAMAQEKLELARALDQENMSNLLVVQRAARPLDKSGPQRAQYVLAFFLLGLGAGALLCYLRPATGPRPDSPTDLSELDLPVVGMVPEFRSRAPASELALRLRATPDRESSESSHTDRRPDRGEVENPPAA